MNAFDSRIAPRTSSSADRLYYLESMDPEPGYSEARTLLDKEYGDPYKLSLTLNGGSVLKQDDSVGIKQLSLFLTMCNNAMQY